MKVSTHISLITGASGFIGSELVRQLQESETRLKLLWHGASRKPQCQPHNNSTFELGDLNDPDSLNAATVGADCIFHLAGLAHVSPPDLTGLRQINVQGTRNLLDAALKNGVKRLVYFSSSLAQACEQGQGEVTAYGQAKLESEKLLLDSAQRGDIEVVIIRPVNVYGVGMKGNIHTLISLIQKRRLPPLPKLTNEISLVGVTDLARAAILAANEQKANGNVYLVTDEENYAINDIENAIYQCFGRKIPSMRSPRMLLYGAAAIAELAGRIGGSGQGIGLRTYRNLTQNNCFSNQAIKTDLGFQATTNFYQQLPLISQALDK